MEGLESLDQSNKSQKVIDENYINSIINCRNSLLICLNQLIKKEIICVTNDILIEICFNHFDDYIKYISTKVIIDYIRDEKLDLRDICNSKSWHCLPQFSQFLCRLSKRISITDCIGFESVINVFLKNLSQMSHQMIESSDKLCKVHCFCYICESMVQIICETNDQNINKLLQQLIDVSRKERCFVHKLIDLMIHIIQRKDGNLGSIETIPNYVIKQNFFEIILISDNFYGFGGKYLSENQVLDNEFGCDVVLLREEVLLFLLTLSSESVMKCISDNEIKERLKVVSDFVRNKSQKFDANDWIIKLFIEEDEQLLSSIYCLIRLNDNQMSHFIMNAFFESVDCDSSVLLDMLCDEQTATLLLKVLLIFLKLSDISDNISINVKNVLLELKHKIQRLRAKQLFPYNVNPLMKLLNKLRK